MNISKSNILGGWRISDRIIRPDIRIRLSGKIYIWPIPSNKHKARQAHWHQLVFSNKPRFNLRDHYDRVRVREYAGQRCLPECVIERRKGRTPGVMVWGAISYHGRSNFQRIESNLNSNRYVHEVPQPEVVSFFQGTLEAIFQQNNAYPYVSKTVRAFCSAHCMQLLPWAAYSLDLSTAELVWNLVGWRLTRHPQPATSKYEIWLRIHAMWNSPTQADIQKCPCHVL